MAHWRWPLRSGTRNLDVPLHPVDPMILLWREQLRRVYTYYRDRRSRTRYFFLKLFLFFVVLNLGCYWLALISAFPHLVFGDALTHYAKIQLPVGLLGALFDSLSFFVTIRLVQRAVASSGAIRFLAHLSIDLVIAFAATWWVLFVFVVSGWMVNLLGGRIYEKDPDGRWHVVSIRNLSDEASSANVRSAHLQQRTELYTDRVVEALRNPIGNLRNIYFGVIMGTSAMLPTCIHLWMFLVAMLKQSISWRTIYPRHDPRTSSNG